MILICFWYTHSKFSHFTFFLYIYTIMKKHLFVLFFLSSFLGLAAKSNLDSLQKVLSTQHYDTNEVRTLNSLCKVFHDEDTGYKKMLDYAKLSVAIAEKLKYKTGLANAYYYLGYARSYCTYYFDSIVNYSEGLKDFFAAEKMYLELNDLKMLPSLYYDVGDDYDYESDYDKALGYFLKSVKYAEQLDNTKCLVQSSLRIGRIYIVLQDYNKAMPYFSSSEALTRNTHDTTSLINSLIGMGDLYVNMKKNETALEKYKDAYNISMKNHDINRAGEALADIGKTFAANGNYAEALKNYSSAYKYLQPINHRKKIIELFSLMAEAYYKQNNFADALDYYKRSYELSKDIGLFDEVSESQRNISRMYEQMGDFKSALDYFKSAARLHDSIYDYNRTKELIQKDMQYQYDKKDAVERAEQEKHEALAAADLKRSALIRNASIVGLILALGLVLVVLQGYNQKKRANEIISKQKQEVELQKEIVDFKNKEMLQSIRYAEHIQKILLKEEEYVSRHLPDHFILYKPKDIVSGDFYWGYEKNEYWYVAAADCTGHGVPGALMSMLGISFLNEIISGEKILSPSEILDSLREKIIRHLGQTGAEGKSTDGMDISLAMINSKTMEVQWAGANNSVYIIKNNLLSEIKADKQPIGYHLSMKPFTNHVLDIDKGSRMYLLTDGYADQFGGPHGKKFKYKQLEETLISINKLPTAQQKQHLNNAFESWKGKYDQVDDVCIIGIHI